MPLVGSAQFLLEIIGLDRGRAQLDKFQKAAVVGSNKVTESFRRQARQLGITIGAFTAAGTVLGPYLQDIANNSAIVGAAVDVVTTTFGALADEMLAPLIPAFQNLSPEIAKALDWVNKLPEPVKVAADAFFLLATAVTAAKIAMTAFGGVSSGLLAPIAVLAGYIAFLDTWVKFVYGSWDNFMRIVKQGPGSFEGAIAAITATSKIIKALDDATGGAASRLGALFNLVTKGPKDFTAITNFLDKWKSVNDVLAGAFNAIVGGMKTLANAFLAGIEAMVNAFITVWNALQPPPWLGGHPIEPVHLPRLERGGEVTKTGVAVVHKGEVYSGAGSAGMATTGGIAATLGAGTLNLTQHIYIDSGIAAAAGTSERSRELYDLFASLGELSGQRTLETIRRRS